MFTILTVLTLAAGVGANTAVFSVLEGVLLKPLPYPHPEQLIGLWHLAPGVIDGDVNMAPSNYFIYREQGRYFQDVGLYQGDSVNITGVAQPEQVHALDVTEGTLPILGAQPILGRGFTPEDTKTGSPDTVLLTYGYWQKTFGGDRSVIGRTLLADGKARRIIGVLPKSFHFLDWEQPQIVFPLQFDRNKTNLGQFSFEGLARLKQGATIEQASSDVEHMLPIVLASFPPPPGFSIELFKSAKFQANLKPLQKVVVGDVSKLLWVLMGSIGMVLLIACANVANLLLVRAEGRQQELAIRSALGASRNRLAGELLLESLVLGILGSLFGLGLAYGALRLLLWMAPSGLPRLDNIGIDGKVLVFNLAVSLLSSLLFGLIPVLRYAAPRVAHTLREGGRTASQGRERHRIRNILVVVQVSLAFVLLICSGLMIRTFLALTHVNPGIDPKAHIQTLELAIPEAEVKDPEQVLRMAETMQHKLEAIPGVTAVAISHKIPMTGQGWSDPIFARDRHYSEGALPPLHRFRFVAPGSFALVGTPILAGRDFTWAELYEKRPLAIVSENTARQLWQTPANALGKQIRVTSKDDWREIIGVVGNVHEDGANQPAPLTVYWPMLQNNFEGEGVSVRRDFHFEVRTARAGSESLMSEVRRALWSVDANAPIADVQTLEGIYNKSMARTSFTLVMIAIAGGMALLLGGVGLYGVIAYSVSQRMREIGIRIALGAQRRDITGMFLRQGVLLAGTGVTCGLLVAVAVMRLMRSLLFQVSPMDPVTYISVCLALIGAAMLASYIPSRRSAVQDPARTLRAE